MYCMHLRRHPLQHILVTLLEIDGTNSDHLTQLDHSFLTELSKLQLFGNACVSYAAEMTIGW